MSLKDTCVSAWEALPVTINASASITNTIDLGGLRLFGVAIPANWTNASLTFQMSPDNGTNWYSLIDQDGSEITAVPTASSCIMLDPKGFASLQYLKIRSGTAASPVLQATASTLKLIVRAV